METSNRAQAYSTDKDDRSLGTLITDLTRKTTTLFQQEVALGKAEVSEKISQLGNGLALLVIGGFILFAGLLKLLDAAIYGIGELLPADLSPWLAAVIVGGIVAIIGIIMLQKGRKNLKPQHLVPHRTAESLQRDKEFAKEQIR
jgi:ABC-type anion transport system duplicated permease subunit